MLSGVVAADGEVLAPLRPRRRRTRPRSARSQRPSAEPRPTTTTSTLWCRALSASTDSTTPTTSLPSSPTARRQGRRGAATREAPTRAPSDRRINPRATRPHERRRPPCHRPAQRTHRTACPSHRQTSPLPPAPHGPAALATHDETRPTTHAGSTPPAPSPPTATARHHLHPAPQRHRSRHSAGQRRRRRCGRPPTRPDRTARSHLPSAGRKGDYPPLPGATPSARPHHRSIAPPPSTPVHRPIRPPGLVLRACPINVGDTTPRRDLAMLAPAHPTPSTPRPLAGRVVARPPGLRRLRSVRS